MTTMVGTTLACWRRYRNVNATALADRIGIKTRTLHYWERADGTELTPEILGDISRAVFALENRLAFLLEEMLREKPAVLVAYGEPEDIKALDRTSFDLGVDPGAYEALLWAAYTRMEGGPPQLRTLEFPSYVRWLKDTGRSDSLRARSDWAMATPPTPIKNMPGAVRD